MQALTPRATWDGFHTLPHPRGGRPWTASAKLPESALNCCSSSPATPQHFCWNKSSQAGSTTSLCAFCDTSSLTCAACSGRAQQPCPPRSVLITRGSGAGRAPFSTTAQQGLAAQESRPALAKPEAEVGIKSHSIQKNPGWER